MVTAKQECPQSPGDKDRQYPPRYGDTMCCVKPRTLLQTAITSKSYVDTLKSNSELS